MPPLPTAARWSAPPEGREEEEIEFSWVGETARHVGTVVHRWLQRIATDELRGWDTARVDALVLAFSRDLERRGVPKPQVKAAADQVATALKNSLSDDRGRWILGPHPEHFTEHRVRLRTDSGVRTYVIDRLFKDTSGERWIVDFKTSRHEGTGLEQFLDEQIGRYGPQLKAYAHAISEARLGLYFPVLNRWRQIS
jgi:ATP-dependent helicase/nuclease subunit A